MSDLAPAASTTQPPPQLQAILLAASSCDAFGPIVEHAPVEMMPLANQPLIGRVVGWLVGLGVRDITVLASHRVDLLSNFLGNGSRWGAKVKVVAVASEGQMFARLPELALADFALVGAAATLPSFDAETLRRTMGAGGGRFVSENGSRLDWSCVARSFFDDAVRDCKRLDDFEARLSLRGAADVTVGNHTLRSCSPKELLLASRAILDGFRPDQLVPGASADKGVYISRNVVLHPTVRIVAPVVIGADCNIDRGARIGPYAVIGEKTILGAHTTLENAVVFPGTYIGPHLELADVVVDHNSLAFSDDKGAVPVPDPFLLSASESANFGQTLRHISCRAAAIVALLLVGLPTLMLYLLGRLMGMAQPLRRIKAVYLPAAADPVLWRTFNYMEFDTGGPKAWQRLVRWLRATRGPTLWNVACGDAAWVGLRPLSAEDMSALPSDWRQLYGSGTVGIVRLSEIDRTFAGDNPDDQIYSSEAYYVATHNLKTDVGILWRGIWKRP